MATPATELNMKPGDTSYADVLERVGWSSGGGGGSVENPAGPSLTRSNNALRAAGRHYYKTQGDAINAVQDALNTGGIQWEPHTVSWEHIAYETTKRYGPIELRDNLWLHITMYRMPSGNYELNAYVDRGSRRSNPRLPEGVDASDVGKAAWKAWMKRGKFETQIGNWGGLQNNWLNIKNDLDSIQLWVTTVEGGYVKERASIGGRTTQDERKLLRLVSTFIATGRMDPAGKVRTMNPFSDRGRESGDILDAIHVGDRVTVVNRFGQERTGRAVMRGPHGWVLNMGGAHGTPHVATNEDIVRVSGKHGIHPWKMEVEGGRQKLNPRGGSDFDVHYGNQEFSAVAKRMMHRAQTSDSLRTLMDVWEWAGQNNEGGDVWVPGEEKGIIVTIGERLRRVGKSFDDLLRFEQRRNPEPAAADMYETFHGTPSTELIEVEEEVHYHEHLAVLGTAIEIQVKVRNRGIVSVTFDGATNLCSNEEGTQLYLIGGDQSLNLGTLGFKKKRKGPHGDVTDMKDKVLLGEIHELTYRTKKSFDKFSLTDYYHGLGEDSGVRPVLVYDTLNKQMEIVGGQYRVHDVGIVN